MQTIVVVKVSEVEHEKRIIVEQFAKNKLTVIIFESVLDSEYITLTIIVPKNADVSEFANAMY